ncbi:MAG TPA: 30S ribosomal protein S8 [Candidatus Paceibacterota bacterium]|nr:30S ribosomal protein S8 [Candidatus Paceibacterota bacterium]
MVTDPIADFLIRLRNASMARKDVVSVPASKMTKALSELLEREGYVTSVDKRVNKSNQISIVLAYKNGRAVIGGAKRISKPSRRMYMSVHDVKPVKRGHGLLVLSTPAGVLTGKEAKEKHVGGEALFEIW